MKKESSEARAALMKTNSSGGCHWNIKTFAGVTAFLPGILSGFSQERFLFHRVGCGTGPVYF